jgi:hypothetical protein
VKTKRLLNPHVALFLLVMVLFALSGCRILVGTVAVTVGAVGLVGYGVYKTGEAAVTGVGSAVRSVTKGRESVVFVNGEFSSRCEGPVETVWLASDVTLKANGFRSVVGSRDALSGVLKAVTWNDQEVVVRLEASGQDQTEVRIRIGPEGDLKKSETLYQLIVAELSRAREAGGRNSL